MKILVINGPNLQLLGKREVSIYGSDSLDSIENSLNVAAGEFGGIELEFYQSNHEGDILDKIASAFDAGYNGIIINPAAFTHSSIAIYDSLRAVDIPAVEVHLSNIHNREDFRKKSVTAGACTGIISGFGSYGYQLALNALIDIINKSKNNNK